MLTEKPFNALLRNGNGNQQKKFGGLSVYTNRQKGDTIDLVWCD